MVVRRRISLTVKASNKAAAAAVEYFLYTVIIIQTAIVAFAYKSILRTAQIWPAGIAYLAAAYFGTFALAFLQLHRLHRARKKAVAARPKPETETVPVEVVAPSTPVPVTEVAAMPTMEKRPVLTAEVGSGETVAATPAGLAFGLTRVQVAIIFLVFLAALKVFSWALASVVRR
jgi:uncharacterized integral membrane protein